MKIGRWEIVWWGWRRMCWKRFWPEQERDCFQFVGPLEIRRAGRYWGLVE